MKKLLIYPVLALLLYSCEEFEHATVKVQNNVHNIKLESISFGGNPIAYSLITGDESGQVTIEDRKGTFPKIEAIKFYMIRGDKRVLLRTKTKYLLNVDQNLTIIISDTTGVINPAL